MKLAQEVLKAYEAHVLECYPEESCGVQVNGKYIPCKNIHETPKNAFRIDPADLILAGMFGEIEAIFHSHPYHPQDKSVFAYYADPRWASYVDQQQFEAGNDVWVIVSTDGTGISEPVILDKNEHEPLLERQFIWAKHDCYNLLQDYYKEKLNIDLPYYPREWNWWGKGQDLFMERFPKEGWERIPYSAVEVNDICLFKNDSKVANHIGIVCGNNEMMQQGLGSLSRISRLDIYARNVIVYLRYVGKKDVTNN